MKKIFSTSYSAGSFNVAMLLLRLALGILIVNHGYDKLIHFDKYGAEFMNFMGLGKTVSLSLVIFAEFFCGIFLILGLFTRLATVPLIIMMAVIILKVFDGDIFAKAELPTLYLAGFIVLLLVGPGRISVDGMVGK